MNVRWLVPVYHATLYTVQHAFHEEAGCEKVSSEDCMTCLQAFASLCALDGGVKSRVRSQHNPFVSVVLKLGDHTRAFWTRLLDLARDQLEACERQLRRCERDGLDGRQWQLQWTQWWRVSVGGARSRATCRRCDAVGCRSTRCFWTAWGCACPPRRTWPRRWRWQVRWRERWVSHEDVRNRRSVEKRRRRACSIPCCACWSVGSRE